jgi:hypothetical protein
MYLAKVPVKMYLKIYSLNRLAYIFWKENHPNLRIFFSTKLACLQIYGYVMIPCITEQC